MRSNLDLKTIFAASDIETARLMIRKAECLHQAGLIDCAEKAALVAALAKMILTPPPPLKGTDGRAQATASLTTVHDDA